MMLGFYGILWQEHVVFKRKFWSTTIGAMVSPILYIIAFGWGLGGGIQIEGASYLQFMIPGVVALTTMMVSFNNTANSINISRMYYKTFEVFMIAPINMIVYALAKILAGAFYGLYSGFLIMLIVTIFGVGPKLTLYFAVIVILNCLVFSAGGFLAGLLINSHADMAKFSNFVITPMSFLCGTFFSISKMPPVIKNVINILPLTHTSQALRQTGGDIKELTLHITVLVVYLVVLFVTGFKLCKKVE